MPRTAKKKENNDVVISKDNDAKIEVVKPFTKPINEMAFEELITLEGVLMQEINYLGEKCLEYRNEANSYYSNSLGSRFAGYDDRKQAEFSLNEKHNKLVSLCTTVHNKIINYILDKWT